MTLNLSHWCIAVVAAAALLALPLPSVASADGTFEFQSDQSHVLAHAKTSDGQGAYFFVFTFPAAVTDASTSQGQCVLNFNNDPKVVECPVARSSTGGLQSSLDAMFVLSAPMACTDTIPLQSSIDNQTYRGDGTLTTNCPQPPPPPPEPTPNPEATPDQTVAGGAVSTPRNPIVVGAGPGGGPHVRLFEPPGMASFFQFDAFGSAFTGGVRVAAGDVNGDGLTDVIVAPGAGGGPNVKVYDGKTGGLIQSFFSYEPSFSGGVFVAAGDVNGDGRADIVTGADSGGPPHIRVFSGADGSELRSFFAFDPSFMGGVRVAAGDVNGDGLADLIAGAGPGGGPQVKVFDGKAGAVIKSFFAGSPSFTGGVFVAAGDVNGDGKADMIVGGGQGGPHVQVFSGQNASMLASFFAYDPSFTGGVRVAAGDVNGDGTPEVITGPGGGAGPNVKVFDGTSALKSFFAFEAGFTGGVFVAGATEPFGARIETPRLVLVGKRVTLGSSCPVGVFGGFCDGSVRLFVPAVQKSAAKKRARPLVLGTKKFRIAAGKRAEVRIALSPRALKKLGRKKKVRAIAEITTRDAGGNASTQAKPVVLTRHR